jgi:predicted nucleotidyltransferase
VKNKDEIIKIIDNLKREASEKYKVKSIGVFGSVVRDEQKETSDIDVLVEFQDGADIFDLMGLELFLQAKFGHSVDVVSKMALRDEIREAVLKEVIYS